MKDMEKITTKFEKEIESKEKLVTELNKKRKQLLDLQLNYASERNKILTTTDWEEKIVGKVTDKAKNAYADDQLQEKDTEIKWLENDISIIRKNIELCNDKISLYKYMIRELEIVGL